MQAQNISNMTHHLDIEAYNPLLEKLRKDGFFTNRYARRVFKNADYASTSYYNLPWTLRNIQQDGVDYEGYELQTLQIGREAVRYNPRRFSEDQMDDLRQRAAEEIAQEKELRK